MFKIFVTNKKDVKNAILKHNSITNEYILILSEELPISKAYNYVTLIEKRLNLKAKWIY